MDILNLTRDEALARSAHLAVEKYRLELDLTDSGERFGSRTTVTFSSSTPGVETFIDIVAPSLRSATLNGEALDVSAGFNGARLQLPNVQAVNELVVDAECEYMHTGEGLHKFVDPVDNETYLYTQFEPTDARRVFACFDQPDLKSVYDLVVTAPSHWKMIGNAPTPEPVSVTESTNRWEFDTTEKMSTYLVAVIAGPYWETKDSLVSCDGRTVELGVLCRPSLQEHCDYDEIFDLTKRGFEYYEKQFDQPYPFTKYDQAFVPEYNMGAMENSGAVTYRDEYLFRSKPTHLMVERRALTILHELAHMWFGNLVTMRWWDDLWLNESFAEWTSSAAMAEATRYTDAWTTFTITGKNWAVAQDQLPSTHPVLADMVDLESVSSNFDGITYAKGASVLKQLVAFVGREAFDEGLREYFRKHAWGNTVYSDLVTELEASSGRDLSAWSEAWLANAGVTTLKPVVSEAADGTIESLTIEQTAPADYPTMRPHRLNVGCYNIVEGKLSRDKVVTVDIDGAATVIDDLNGIKRPDLLLVNDDDLTYCKLRLDDKSLATAIRHLDSMDDALARVLVWAAAWDMTRDAEMRASDFVNLVTENLGAEDNPNTRFIVARQLPIAVSTFVCPDKRADVRRVATERMWGLAQHAEAGSDAQLVLVKSVISLARDEDHLDIIQSILDGEAGLAGLAVDTDLRWALVHRLAAGGRIDRAGIDKELAQDDTSAGREQAAMAYASLPSAEEKARAFADVMEDGDMPNSVLSAIASGFLNCHDVSLIEGYTDRFFELLPDVWKRLTPEMAGRATDMFPTPLFDKALVEKTQSYLAATADLPSAHGRQVSEILDDGERALRVQEFDAS